MANQDVIDALRTELEEGQSELAEALAGIVAPDAPEPEVGATSAQTSPQKAGSSQSEDLATSVEAGTGRSVHRIAILGTVSLSLEVPRRQSQRLDFFDFYGCQQITEQ